MLFRIGGIYIVESARRLAARSDSDLTKILILFAISRANTRSLNDPLDTARRYASLMAIPPDTVRLPISIYGLSRDLGLPYETVRRHVQALKRSGKCAAVNKGLIVPQTALNTPGAFRAVAANFEATRKFAEDAAPLTGEDPVALRPISGDVSRYVVRLSTEYFVEAMTIMSRRLEMSMVSVLVLRTLSVASGQGIALVPAMEAAFANRDEPPAPDGASVYAVAKYLLMPYETTRRVVAKLEMRGLVERRPDGGWTVPFDVPDAPAMRQAIREVVEVTHTYLARLAAVGIGARPQAAAERVSRAAG